MLRRAFAFTMPDLKEAEMELPTLNGILEKPGTAPLAACQGGRMTAGAVVSFGPGGHNILELLWVDPDRIDGGIGCLLWNMIECSCPLAKSWETIIAACLPRNVYFYVNKCGFHIVKVEFEDGDQSQCMYHLRKEMEKCKITVPKRISRQTLLFEMNRTFLYDILPIEQASRE